MNRGGIRLMRRQRGHSVAGCFGNRRLCVCGGNGACSCKSNRAGHVGGAGIVDMGVKLDLGGWVEGQLAGRHAAGARQRFRRPCQVAGDVALPEWPLKPPTAVKMSVAWL